MIPGIPKPGFVSLLVNGMIYEGWKKAEVSRSVKEMAGQFQLVVTERWSGGAFGISSIGGWRIRPGDQCVLLYSGQPVITGYVDVYNPSYDAESHTVSIQGRSKTADLCDSSAELPKGELRKVNFEQGMRKLAAPFGIPIKMLANAPKVFDRFAVHPGETVHETAERYSRSAAVTLTDDTDGALRILQVEDGGGVTALIEGVNIKDASSTIRADNRHSEYVARGQRPGNDQEYGEKVARVAAKVKDSAVKRHRPLHVNTETSTKDQDVRDRASWEAASRAGESVSVDATVVGWEYAAGQLWMPGLLVDVMSPMLAINRTLAIESLTHTQDDSGTLTKLKLVPPEAINPKPGGGKGNQGTDAAYTTSKPSVGPTGVP